MAFQGIPVRVATYGDDGEPTGYEIAVFATLRRCPKLGGLLKAVGRASVAEDGACRRAALAQRAVMQAETAEAVQAAEAVATEAADAAEAATQAYAEAVSGFVRAGFEGAGYTPEQADRYAGMIGAFRLGELKAACLVGSGRLDFTKAPAAG